MFTADGKPSDDDPRENGPRLGDERTTLVESLRCQRLTLEMKCSGLDAEAMARRSVEPSTMSLLGLVRHLAEMERATFRVLMAGQDVPRLFSSETDRDGDFDGAVPDPRVVAQAWEAWRAEVDFATRFVAEAPSLDITADDPEISTAAAEGRCRCARCWSGRSRSTPATWVTPTCCASGSTGASASNDHGQYAGGALTIVAVLLLAPADQGTP